jgi:hypothetical protein
MKLEELDRKISEIEGVAKQERSKAIIEYCKANNKVNIGDIVGSKHGEFIKVDRIEFSGGSIRLDPQCVYRGFTLKKNLELRKDGKRDMIMQSSASKHIPVI